MLLVWQLGDARLITDLPSLDVDFRAISIDEIRKGGGCVLWQYGFV